MDKDYISIFDTTLRDGEQCPGAAMNEDEKLAIAHQLAHLNVDTIEAGFPISSPLQFKTVQRVAEEVQGPKIAALARAKKEDILTAAKAIQNARKPRIHVFIATSDIHMKHKLNKKSSEVLKMAREAVKMAKDHVEDVEFSAEDATRSNIDFLIEVTEAVIEEGASTINLPDTVGYTTPSEYGNLFRTLKERVSNIDKAILSTHCHNDLGLAVSNSLSAVLNGARQIECTINGIGERAGNTAMEEVVMSIKTRHNVYPFKLGIKTGEIYKTSRLTSKFSGMIVQRNKAIVGLNAFAHESGIHQDGMLKNRLTYEIMTPESIGINGSSIILGRHSGRSGFKNKIKELGIESSKINFEKAYQRFLEIADKKKEVFVEDIWAILDDQLSLLKKEKFRLEDFKITSGSSITPTATVTISDSKNNFEQSITVEAIEGDGPVDALFKAIEKATKTKTWLEYFNITPSTQGKDAMGEAMVGLKIDNIVYYGKGTSTDIVEASARAFIDAINESKIKLAKGEKKEISYKGI